LTPVGDSGRAVACHHPLALSMPVLREEAAR
jgi:hypothetical protein